jgi:endogenous inhibitor of DNA gyrase (YacG/DUF329 family)
MANKWKEATSTNCAMCGKEMHQKMRTHRFCSKQCKGKWKYYAGEVSTDSQYERISGNWPRYLARLLYFGGRKRDLLTRDILMAQLIKQDYKCALSGLPLTCTMQKGVKTKTNVSVDRIVAGGTYSANNIQLVCQALNAWRNDTNIDEFVEWCRAVVTFNDAKGK